VDFRLKRSKHAIRVFLRTAYTDERLAWLLAHARSGKLSYHSCCCLVGVATADHRLEGRTPASALPASHYALAKRFVGAPEAELAYRHLGLVAPRCAVSADEERRRRLIPMIRAEMRRREWLRAQREAQESLVPARLGARLDLLA
jgi:hypothetical protein